MKRFLYAMLFFLLLIGVCRPDSSSVTQWGEGIRYRWEGQGDTTLVFIHGWCEDASYWRAQENYFKENYRLLLLDLPGLGLAEQYNGTDYAKEMPQFLKEEVEQPVVIIAHSMGADIALQSEGVLKEQLLKWVVVEDYKFLGASYSVENQKEIDRVVEKLEQDFESIAIPFAKTRLFDKDTNNLIYRKIVQDIARVHPKTAALAMKNSFDFTEERKSLLAQSNQKLYLIQGSVVGTNESALERIGLNYDLNVIKKAGHYPMLEQADSFNLILQKIIED